MKELEPKAKYEWTKLILNTICVLGIVPVIIIFKACFVNNNGVYKVPIFIISIIAYLGIIFISSKNEKIMRINYITLFCANAILALIFVALVFCKLPLTTIFTVAYVVNTGLFGILIIEISAYLWQKTKKQKAHYNQRR